MIKRNVEIINRLGLHARAAAKLVRTASQFEADVEVIKDGKTANAKSIMSIMMLAAAQGATVEVSADGPDEAAAIESIEHLIADRFGENQ